MSLKPLTKNQNFVLKNLYDLKIMNRKGLFRKKEIIENAKYLKNKRSISRALTDLEKKGLVRSKFKRSQFALTNKGFHLANAHIEMNFLKKNPNYSIGSRDPSQEQLINFYKQHRRKFRQMTQDYKKF